MSTSEQEFKTIYERLHTDGKISAPRGLKIKEVENFTYELMPYTRFANFESRKLSLDYIKKEFLWYLKGDARDTSITESAKMWKDLINEDGTINSNYGQYIFAPGAQFDNVIEILKKDKDSRRACMVILNENHLYMKTNDVPCTAYLNFRIRDHRLNMSVHMRSQDSIYGMGNDAPTFSFIQEMMCNALEEFYPDIWMGRYHHIADSFHIYEKHFTMLDRIIHDDAYTEIDCPKISGPEEVRSLIALNFHNIPENFKFSKWLITFNANTTSTK